MRLILVRHGETDENAKEIVQGHTDTLLNEKGKEQARKVSLRLKDEKIDMIFSSDLRRARETAEEISKFHKAPVKISKELRERNYGSVELKFVREYSDILEKSGKARYAFKPEGGESFPDVVERAKRFLEKIQKYEGKTVVIVSHGGFIRMLLSLLTGKSMEEAGSIKIYNTAVSIIEADKEHIINCTKHLDQ